MGNPKDPATLSGKTEGRFSKQQAFTCPLCPFEREGNEGTSNSNKPRKGFFGFRIKNTRSRRVDVAIVPANFDVTGIKVNRCCRLSPLSNDDFAIHHHNTENILRAGYKVDTVLDDACDDGIVMEALPGSPDICNTLEYLRHNPEMVAFAKVRVIKTLVPEDEFEIFVQYASIHPLSGYPRLNTFGRKKSEWSFLKGAEWNDFLFVSLSIPWQTEITVEVCFGNQN